MSKIRGNNVYYSDSMDSANKFGVKLMWNIIKFYYKSNFLNKDLHYHWWKILR
jgi:hypothetical protein